ncbi:DUF3237 family protein [Rhodobacter capsulatus]|uniref:DUF3237 family protein n=1 Tax=Rhodobacter capsulatus TaxID=1061 RepID=A0A4U1JRW9_RHOCA|nr:DUF3237 family protein [Rhodobacter capsulatus]TKD21920.1 DUF3237 family protein [Rhodobacter capsulatus]
MMFPTLDDDSARFGLRLALRLAVTLGPDEEMGACAGGLRRNYPITGGCFVGRNIRGAVIGSGADISVLRPDGICEVDALYRIRAEDGTIIVVHNHGLYDAPEFGPRGRDYLVTRPAFIAPTGQHDWLNRSLFIGTVDDIEGGVLVSCYEVHRSQAA